MAAFLMLLQEKMRLSRRANSLTLRQLQSGNKLSRIKNKIAKRQKYYSRLEKNLETQANMYKNAMKMQISNFCGLGDGAVNLMNPYGFGASSAALKIIQGWVDNGGKAPFGENGTQFDSDIVQAIMLGQVKKNADGSFVTTDNSQKPFDQTQYENANKIISFANSQASQMQAMCQQYQANYEQQVSVWLEYQKEQLDAQQEYELDMLAEEENDYEMEKTNIEAELELIKERKNAIQNELAEAAKDTAPKFGLA